MPQEIDNPSPKPSSATRELLLSAGGTVLGGLILAFLGWIAPTVGRWLLAEFVVRGWGLMAMAGIVFAGGGLVAWVVSTARSRRRH